MYGDVEGPLDRLCLLMMTVKRRTISPRLTSISARRRSTTNIDPLRSSIFDSPGASIRARRSVGEIRGMEVSIPDSDGGTVDDMIDVLNRSVGHDLLLPVALS